jgi:hypothetical protein
MARSMGRLGWLVVIILIAGYSMLSSNRTQTPHPTTLGSPTEPTSDTSPTTSAPQPLIGVRTLYVTASKLNVRSAPNANGSVLLTVPRATKVVTLSTRNGWYEVALNDGSSGWVSGEFLAERPPSETVTPRPSAPAVAAPAFDRTRVVQAIIEESIWSTGGSCPCPYNVDRGGRRCGGRSAYSRPGGASPICFPEQVTDRMIQQYLSRN